MSDPAHSTLFENAIAVKSLDSHTYEAHLDPAWCIGVVPHGGYTASILYRTASLHLKTRHKSNLSSPEPINFQITFLRRTRIGRAVLTVQDIKLGGRLSTIHITLSQKSDTPTKGGEGGLETELAAYITLGSPDFESGPAVTGPWGLSPPPPPGSDPNGAVNLDSLAEIGRDGSWARFPDAPRGLFAAQHIELYTPENLFAKDRTVGERVNQVVDQWARFRPGGAVAQEKGKSGATAKWSNEAVMYLLDLFPAALNRLGAMEDSGVQPSSVGAGSGSDGGNIVGGYWYPTVTMNIDLKTRIPEGMEWLHSRVVTRMLRGGRADLDVVVLDQRGAVVATSSQVALVVDVGRNTKGRNTKGRL
ncbi:thioesterase-like superfamily-domain-containing protein [Aspergillus karnatakaensis]|uniref:thioesterase family protein n=1 Tax=Aspergillus karnatakaensis TaxID=1810916 RepID=UPI003CCCE15A